MSIAKQYSAIFFKGFHNKQGAHQQWIQQIPDEFVNKRSSIMMQKVANMNLLQLLLVTELKI
jgi:hypothetical protein